MILTVPGNDESLVKVSSSSTGSSSSSMLNCDTISAVSTSSSFHGGEPDDLKMPEAAAWVSVGELRDAEGLWPLELRAMRMWDGFVVIAGRESIASPIQPGIEPSHSHVDRGVIV